MTDNSCRCFHCGETTTQAEGQRWATEIDGALQPMCCPGCKAVAETIVGAGLKDYYRHRTELPEISPAELDETSDLAQGNLIARDSLTLYDSAAMQKRFVARHTSAEGQCIAEATLVIDGISCAACSWLIEHRLSAMEAVTEATLNLSNHRLVLSWKDDQISISALMEAIYRLGYRASPFSATEQENQRTAESKRAIRRLAVAGIGMMQVMMIAVPLYVGMAEQYEFFMRMASMVLALPVVLFSARPFFEAAIRDLRTRHLTMDVPVSLAILLAFCASIWSTLNQGKEVYFDSVCMFTFFLLLGRYFEMRARHRMGKSGNNLLTLLPNIAVRLHQGNEEVIATEDIRVGDQLLIKPGQAIPADGTVIEGSSSVDEAALTGEYLPIAKQAGSPLIGGTTNVENPLTMAVTATGAEAQLSTIMRLMDRAQQEKPKVALLADQVASKFVAAVILISTAVFTFWFSQGNDHAFFIALSVLVVTCPCALSLATPTALTAATGALRDAGLLISKGHVLETLPKISRVVFDKTGTLTLGKLTLERTEPLSDRTAEELVTLATAMEKQSTHPIARAFSSFRSRASDALQLQDIDNHTGKGISATLITNDSSDANAQQQLKFGRPDFAWPNETLPLPSEEPGGQWLLLADQHRPLGWFLMADSPRRQAGELIQQLHQRGIKTALLTGDPSASGAALAQRLGIEDYQTGLSPDEKLAQVRHWQQNGEQILMVGDGINDVPVLAGAEVSLAVSEATDLAKTNADALLTSGKLDAIVRALDSSRATRRVIYQNIGWALGYNLVALPLAAAGLVPPWAAAIGMSFSSLLVVGNALRLARIQPAGA